MNDFLKAAGGIFIILIVVGVVLVLGVTIGQDFSKYQYGEEHYICTLERK